MTSKKLFFGLLTALVVVLGLTVFIFTYTRGKFDDALQRIAVKQAEIDIADREYAQLLTVEQQLEDFDVDLDPFLPKSKSQSEALELVFDVFRDANVSIRSYTFTPTEGLPGATSQSQPSSAGNVLSLPLQISPDDGNISYQDLMRLLKGLENAQRQLNINRLNISSVPLNPENTQGERGINLTIDLTVQYLKEMANAQ